MDRASLDAPRLTRRAFASLVGGVLLAACRRREGSASASLSPRVVSLSPSTTEAIAAIGAGALLVGRSQHCDFPPEVVRLPSVGGYAEPDVERILSLAPTLVVGERGPAGPSLEARLSGHGVATLFPPTGSVDEVGAMLLLLGDALGRREDAERVRRTMLARVQALSTWARGRPSPSVVLVFDAKPLFVAGPGGFLDELVRLAGGTNAIRAGGAYPTIDVERLLALDPDVLIDATSAADGPSMLPKLEGWDRLSAVKAGRVRRLASSAAMRPGPRLDEGLRAVIRALYGEAPPSEDSRP